MAYEWDPDKALGLALFQKHFVFYFFEALSELGLRVEPDAESVVAERA